MRGFTSQKLVVSFSGQELYKYVQYCGLVISAFYYAIFECIECFDREYLSFLAWDCY
jgi:hypothetical protein